MGVIFSSAAQGASHSYSLTLTHDSHGGLSRLFNFTQFFVRFSDCQMHARAPIQVRSYNQNCFNNFNSRSTSIDF